MYYLLLTPHNRQRKEMMWVIINILKNMLLNTGCSPHHVFIIQTIYRIEGDMK